MVLVPSPPADHLWIGKNRGNHESMRAFKGIFCNDISEFESYMPSHAVRSLWRFAEALLRGRADRSPKVEDHKGVTFAPVTSLLVTDDIGVNPGGTISGVDKQFSQVPGPIVGAGLPGLIVACGGLVALARRRRKLIA